MANCPNCEQELDYLKAHVKEEKVCDYLGSDEWGREELLDTVTDEYKCPHCSSVVCHDRESADALLKGGD